MSSVKLVSRNELDFEQQAYPDGYRPTSYAQRPAKLEYTPSCEVCPYPKACRDEALGGRKMMPNSSLYAKPMMTTPTVEAAPMSLPLNREYEIRMKARPCFNMYANNLAHTFEENRNIGCLCKFPKNSNKWNRFRCCFRRRKYLTPPTDYEFRHVSINTQSGRCCIAAEQTDFSDPNLADKRSIGVHMEASLRSTGVQSDRPEAYVTATLLSDGADTRQKYTSVKKRNLPRGPSTHIPRSSFSKMAVAPTPAGRVPQTSVDVQVSATATINELTQTASLTTRSNTKINTRAAPMMEDIYSPAPSFRDNYPRNFRPHTARQPPEHVDANAQSQVVTTKDAGIRASAFATVSKSTSALVRSTGPEDHHGRGQSRLPRYIVPVCCYCRQHQQQTVNKLVSAPSLGRLDTSHGKQKCTCCCSRKRSPAQSRGRSPGRSPVRSANISAEISTQTFIQLPIDSKYSSEYSKTHHRKSPGHKRRTSQ